MSRLGAHGRAHPGGRRWAGAGSWRRWAADRYAPHRPPIWHRAGTGRPVRPIGRRRTGLSRFGYPPSRNTRRPPQRPRCGRAGGIGGCAPDSFPIRSARAGGRGAGGELRPTCTAGTIPCTPDRGPRGAAPPWHPRRRPASGIAPHRASGAPAADGRAHRLRLGIRTPDAATASGMGARRTSGPTCARTPPAPLHRGRRSSCPRWCHRGESGGAQRAASRASPDPLRPRTPPPPPAPAGPGPCAARAPSARLHPKAPGARHRAGVAHVAAPRACPVLAHRRRLPLARCWTSGAVPLPPTAPTVAAVHLARPGPAHLGRLGCLAHLGRPAAPHGARRRCPRAAPPPPEPRRAPSPPTATPGPCAWCAHDQRRARIRGPARPAPGHVPPRSTGPATRPSWRDHRPRIDRTPPRGGRRGASRAPRAAPPDRSARPPVLCLCTARLIDRGAPAAPWGRSRSRALPGHPPPRTRPTRSARPTPCPSQSGIRGP